MLSVGSLVENLEYRDGALVGVLRTKRVVVYCVLEGYREVEGFNPRNYLADNRQHQR